jgi:hypothetical protein
MKNILLHSTFMNKAKKKRLNTTQHYRGIAFFTRTHYNIPTILENVSHSKKGQDFICLTLLIKCWISFQLQFGQ